MRPNEPDRSKLIPLLESVSSCVEALLLGGLTTASESSRQTLERAFQEAARTRLLRLGVCLRTAAEELGRFVRGQPDFSSRRLLSCLTRAWLLSRALAKALRTGDTSGFDRFSWTVAEDRCARLEVVALGVIPRLVAGSHCAFEFRLRVLASTRNELAAGQPVVWSCVVPFKAAGEIPVEPFLFLPQKQGFTPSIFLERGRVILENCSTGQTPSGIPRVVIGDDTKVSKGPLFDDWRSLVRWDPRAALSRLAERPPSPLDLEIDPQEEVVLEDWSIEPPRSIGKGLVAYPVGFRGQTIEALVPPGPLTETLKRSLEELEKQKTRPALYGFLHYERCRLAIHPVAAIDRDGPTQLLLDPARLDRKLLVKAFTF